MDCPVISGSCQQPVPSWSTEIHSIVDRSCNPCHFPPDGQALLTGATAYDFSTYATFHHAPGSTIAKDLRDCFMPLDGGGDVPLSAADRAALVDWVVCGEPDN